MRDKIRISESEDSEFVMETINDNPNPWDYGTVLAMAQMSSNAYLDIISNKSDWLSIPGFESKISYGHGGNGVRGYVYVSTDNKLVIISVKGTSASFLGYGGGPSSARDKVEDNMMFSCCCAAVDSSWKPICPCSISQTVCNQTCLYEYSSKPAEISYVDIVLKIRDTLDEFYPNAKFWFTGHSLGGAVASLAAYVSDCPAITFEAPGDLKYARTRRLSEERESRRKKKGDSKPELKSMFLSEANDTEVIPIWQFGLTTDPIFTGQCNGAYSTCYIAGYAMETKCHLGNYCILDNDGGEGKKVNLLDHKISYVLSWLQNNAFNPSCLVEESNCSDCPQWKFINGF